MADHASGCPAGVDNRAGMSSDVERWSRCAEAMAEANAKAA